MSSHPGKGDRHDHWSLTTTALPLKANRIRRFPFHSSSEQRIYGSRMQGAEQPPCRTSLCTSPLYSWELSSSVLLYLLGEVFCYAFDLPVHLPCTSCQCLNFKCMGSKHCVLKIYTGPTVLGTGSPKTISFLRVADRGRIPTCLPFSSTLLQTSVLGYCQKKRF